MTEPQQSDRGASRPKPWSRLPSSRVRLAVLALLSSFVVGGCSIHDIHHGGTPLPGTGQGAWVLLPWENRAEAPRVGERLEPVLRTLLLSCGVERVDSCPNLEADEVLPILDDRERVRRAREWARQEGYRFAVLGSVTEWRYKAGLDGEPAVGLSVSVVDLAENRTVWSASGARAGWGRESLSGAAQKLLRALLSELELEPYEPPPSNPPSPHLPVQSPKGLVPAKSGDVDLPPAEPSKEDDAKGTP